MDISRATPELFAAIAKAQAEVENAGKNAANPHFRSRYADLAEVLNTVRPVFAKNGLGIMQGSDFDGAMVHVTTCISHASGGSVSSVFSCVPAKSDAQGIGSATTYGRRYSLAAMAGVAQEDDDGNASAHGAKPAPVGTADAAVVAEWIKSIQECHDVESLDALGSSIAKAGLSDATREKVKAAFMAHKSALKKAAA